MSCSFVIPSSKLSLKTCIDTNNSVFNTVLYNRAVIEDQGPGMFPHPTPATMHMILSYFYRKQKENGTKRKYSYM